MDAVVVYDICTEDAPGRRRLARVAKVCEGFGIRVQKSVFECRLPEASFEKLLQQLRKEINPSFDSVIIYRIRGDVDDVRTTFGRPPATDLGGAWLV